MLCHTMRDWSWVLVEEIPGRHRTEAQHWNLRGVGHNSNNNLSNCTNGIGLLFIRIIGVVDSRLSDFGDE